MLDKTLANGKTSGHVSVPQPSRQASERRELSHILIPTALRPSERQAVSVGLQIAGATGAKVTLLHVMSGEPVSDPPNAWNWLDAIDNLHRALEPAVTSDVPRIGPEQTRTLVADYLERELPGYSKCGAEIHVECRAGDLAGEILRYAAAESVDLVILSSDFSYWGLPMLPPHVQRVLHQMDKRVIVVRRGEWEPTTGYQCRPDSAKASLGES